jgi:hypothetical protein
MEIKKGSYYFNDCNIVNCSHAGKTGSEAVAVIYVTSSYEASVNFNNVYFDGKKDEYLIYGGSSGSISLSGAHFYDCSGSISADKISGSSIKEKTLKEANLENNEQLLVDLEQLASIFIPSLSDFSPTPSQSATAKQSQQYGSDDNYSQSPPFSNAFPSDNSVDAQEKSKTSLPISTIVGATIVGLAAIILGSLFLFCLIRRKKQNAVSELSFTEFDNSEFQNEVSEAIFDEEKIGFDPQEIHEPEAGFEFQENLKREDESNSTFQGGETLEFVGEDE